MVKSVLGVILGMVLQMALAGLSSGLEPKFCNELGQACC